MEDLPRVVISALVGAVVSWVGAMISNALAMRAKIDEGLRDTRIKVYALLWKDTNLLPKWPRATDVTYERLAQLSAGLRDWYFDQGGMYLSTQARGAYGALQESLSRVLQKHKSGPVADEHYETIRTRCSGLRTELTNDLLSRKRTFLL